MVQFHLGENSISFSDDFNKLNTLRTDIIDDMSQFSIYDSMEQLISKHGKMPNVDEVASSFPLMVNQLICEAIVPIIVNFLVENEIYDCSEELFIHRYQERYFNFAKQPQFQNFLSHYVNLANEYMEKRTQKAYNRANRSQWMGGGFGITGAIKGAAQAAVLNAATGVVRGIGDVISDFASSTAYKSKQNSLLSDDVFQEFDIALQNCIHGCILACQIEYSTHKGILCSWSQRENIEKSFAIFNNVQTRVTDTSKIARLMSTAIELSPYNEEYYSFLYRQDGIDKTEVLALAEYLGFSLYADRLELMDTALDALLDQLSSPAQYGECAKGIIALGQKYSLISSDDCIHATVKGDEAAGTLIKSSFEFAVHGLYHEAMEQSRAGNNSAEQHRIYLQSLEDLKKRYDYPNLPELDPSAINEIQELENASDLRVAAEVQQQQYFVRAMRELRQFYRNESLSSKERITAILDFAERRHIPVTNGIASSSSTPTIANAVTMALAVEELNSRYTAKIKEQIHAPSSEIYQIRDAIQQLFTQRGIVDSQKPFEIIASFKTSGSDVYNAILADCADLLNIPTQIARYLDNYADPHKDDNDLRKKIASAIVNQCLNYPQFPCTSINTTLDENWAKKGEFSDHKSVYVGDFGALVPKDDIVCMYYSRKSFLDSTYTVITTSGIYYPGSYMPTGRLWKDIKEEPKESYHPKIIFKSTDHIFEFGKDLEGLELLKKCIKTAQSLLVQKIIPNHKINSSSFLCERLHHYLSPDEQSSVYLTSGSQLYGSSEHPNSNVTGTSPLKAHLSRNEFILQHESNPFINIIINIESPEVSARTIDHFLIIVLTNSFLYFLDGQNEGCAIHVEDLQSIELEKSNDSSYIEISSSDKIFSKRLKNPTIDSPTLFDHLNQALAIELRTKIQSPDKLSQPEEHSQSNNIFCPYCGKKIPRSSKFCCFCGSKINYKK